MRISDWSSDVCSSDLKRRGGQGGCNANLQYGMAWANRMPAEFPVYPKAKLMEAAGADGGGCDLRAVSFVPNTRLQNVLDYYYTKEISSGFDAEHQLMNGEHGLGWVRERTAERGVGKGGVRMGRLWWVVEQ